MKKEGWLLFAFLVVYIGGMTSFVFSETLPNSKTIVNVASATYIINNNLSKSKIESNKVHTTVDLTIPNVIYPGENTQLPPNFTLMGLAEEDSEVEIIFSPIYTPGRKKENKNIVFKTRTDNSRYYWAQVKNLFPCLYNVKIVNNGSEEIKLFIVEVRYAFPSGYPEILDISYLDGGRKLNVTGTSSPNKYLIVYNYNTTIESLDIVGMGTSDKKGKFNIILNGQIPLGNDNMLFVVNTTNNTASEAKRLKLQGLPPNEGDIYVYNYPNPMTDGTTFRYYLPETSNVTLEIFNTAGRRLTYFNTQGIGKNDDGIGWNEYPWDGRTGEGMYLSNGVYIYRLTATLWGKSVSKTNKLLISR